MLVFGLDIGVSSIGWCVLRDSVIAGAGVRIFPANRKIGGLSPRQQRQKHKAARVKNRKSANYLKQLATLLVAAGLLPQDDRASSPDVGTFLMNAMIAPVLPYQFGAILMYLAKHRGKPARNGQLLKIKNNPRDFAAQWLQNGNRQRRDTTSIFSRLWKIQRPYLPVQALNFRLPVAKLLFGREAPNAAAKRDCSASEMKATPHQAASQLAKLLDALIRKYGGPNNIATELFEAPAMRSRQTVKRNNEAGLRRAKLLETLWLELPEVSGDVRQCIYSGEPLHKSILHTGLLEVDHIVPRSCGGSNRQDNFLLCSAAANREKNHRILPKIAAWQPQMAAILERAKSLPAAKQKRLQTGLEPPIEHDYDSSLGVATRIALKDCLAALKLRFAVSSVKLTHISGHDTAKHREEWLLDGLLHNGRSKNNDCKNRNDHRHHVIDAFVLAQLAESGGYKGQNAFRLALADVLPRVFASHKIDRGKTMLTHETAYGPTALHDECGRSFGVIRKPASEIWTLKEAEKIRDLQLRQLILESIKNGAQDKDGALFAHINRTAHPRIPPKRIRLLETINHPVAVHGKNRCVTKFLKPGANFRYDVWHLPDGKWQAEIVTIAQIRSGNWQSAVKRLYPTARKVLRLHHNDTISLAEGQQTHIMRVVKFSANDRICLADVNSAGDLKARDADRSDPFNYCVKSASGLKKCDARHINIDLLGALPDAAFTL